MVDRKRTGDELREEFSVLGSTGNVSALLFGRLTRLHQHRCILLSSIKHHPATACRVFFRFQLAPDSRRLIGPDANKGNHCKHIVKPLLLRITSISNHLTLSCSSF